MLKYLRKILKLNLRRSSLAASKKMVRYFTNNYPDFTPGDTPVTNVGKITSNIDEHISHILKRIQPSAQNVDGGLYVGVTGIAYAFYHLSKNSILTKNKQVYLQKALEYLQPALENAIGDQTSFLLGDCGTYALAAVLYHGKNAEKSKEYLNQFQSLRTIYLQPNFLKCGADELFVGRAGYLAAALWMRREMETPVLTNEQLYEICNVIVKSGRVYATQRRSECPLMFHYYNTEYLGAAHGLSFILQMLLSVPGYLEYDSSAAKDLKQSLNYMANIQTEEGNWPCTREEIGSDEHYLIHWCHGAPGSIYLMAKAFLIFRDKKYLETCIKAGDLIWEKGLLRKGPGICHGVAGNGYSFLLLYRLTGNEIYLYRAKMFAEFMDTELFHEEAQIPDNPDSLYEGRAGTVCFLADVMVPDKAEFPFQDVFST